MSNQNNNDSKILELKLRTKEKKDKLKIKKKFVPITNCSLEFRGLRYNLNVLTKEQLTLLLIELDLYNFAVNHLVITNFTISGYKLEDWITDIKSKLEISNLKEEEIELQELENELELMLSNEKKVELKINKIELMLK